MMEKQLDNLLKALQADEELVELQNINEDVKDLLNKMASGEVDVEDAREEYFKLKK